MFTQRRLGGVDSRHHLMNPRPTRCARIESTSSERRRPHQPRHHSIMWNTDWGAGATRADPRPTQGTRTAMDERSGRLLARMGGARSDTPPGRDAGKRRRCVRSLAGPRNTGPRPKQSLRPTRRVARASSGGSRFGRRTMGIGPSRCLGADVPFDPSTNVEHEARGLVLNRRHLGSSMSLFEINSQVQLNLNLG